MPDRHRGTLDLMDEAIRMLDELVLATREPMEPSNVQRIRRLAMKAIEAEHAARLSLERTTQITPT
jgi:hypothetical protein